MTFQVTVTSIYNCSLERAFKTPLLCNVSKVHTGFLFMPKVTHVSDDKNWGQPGSSKKIYAAKSLTQKGGFVSMDTVIERNENQYWKFQVHHFQSWMLGFYKFVGEWNTKELQAETVLITYTYTLYANQFLLYPLNWLFANTFWKIYMKRVLNNVHEMARNDEPYQYP